MTEPTDDPVDGPNIRKLMQSGHLLPPVMQPFDIAMAMGVGIDEVMRWRNEEGLPLALLSGRYYTNRFRFTKWLDDLAED